MSGSKKLLSSSGIGSSGDTVDVDTQFNVNTYSVVRGTSYPHVTTQPTDIMRIETGIDLRGTTTSDVDQYFSTDRWIGSGYARTIDNGLDLANNDLTQQAVNSIVADMYSNYQTYGSGRRITLNLRGNSTPGEEAIEIILLLRQIGWTITFT